MRRFRRSRSLNYAHDELRRSFNLHLGEQGITHEVVVEFSKEKALLVSSREWHLTQRIEKLDDGRIRLAFDCPDVSSAVSWILEWGPHARVTAPPELVQLVKSDLDGARAQY
jgi:predicted DNA-binding transcriptional regulator YafY